MDIMMKLKGLILCGFMLAMSLSTAFASEITYEIENNHLKLSGALGEDYAYRMITLQLSGPFESYCEFPQTAEKTGTEFKELEKTEFITLYLDENGGFSYSFYPSADNRFYSVAAYAHGFNEPWSKTFLNVSDTLEGDIVLLINSAERWEEIKNLFDNPSYYNVLTYYYPVFRDIKEQENLNKVYLALYEAKEDAPFENLTGNYGDVIMSISAVMNINEMAENKMADARLIAEANIQLNNAPLYDFYKDMTQKQKENVFKRLMGNEYSDLTAFMESFDTAVFLQMVESEEFKNNITDLLNKYAEKYNVKLDGYSANKSAVNNAVYGKYFKTADELSDAIKKAVKENTNTGVNSGSGSSSSSGSGSSGNGFYPIVKNPNKAEVVKTEIFSDLGSVSWAKEAVEALYDLGVVNGRAEKIFDPNADVKREEFVKMLFLATKQQYDDNDIEFTDVNKEAWYHPYIASGVKLGWIQGISETLFGVGSPLTRQDMAVLIERASGIESEISQALFSDDNLISDYAKEAVYRLRNTGIVNGDNENRFNPKACATRAEAAKVIYEMIVKGDEE